MTPEQQAESGAMRAGAAALRRTADYHKPKDDAQAAILTDAADRIERGEPSREELHPDGYWHEEDHEYGYNDLADLLDDAEPDGVYPVTPWVELPTVFAAQVPSADGRIFWKTFASEAEARAALGDRA